MAPPNMDVGSTRDALITDFINEFFFAPESNNLQKKKKQQQQGSTILLLDDIECGFRVCRRKEEQSQKKEPFTVLQINTIPSPPSKPAAKQDPSLQSSPISFSFSSSSSSGMYAPSKEKKGHSQLPPKPPKLMGIASPDSSAISRKKRGADDGRRSAKRRHPFSTKKKSSTSLWAMIITLLFFAITLFQGMLQRTS